MTSPTTPATPARPVPRSGSAVRAPSTPQTASARGAGGHVAGLDGLRAIAVTAVILYHLTPGFFAGGYLGVDVFFVISGFLITGLLLRERAVSGRIRLYDFWRRRVRRLIPALVLLVTACSTAALVIGGDVLVHLGRQVLAAATFSSNWLSIVSGTSYFDTTSPELFRNLWSLAVEEQFYVIWPLAVLALLLVKVRWVRRLVVALLALGSAAAMAIVYLPGADATRVYYGTDTHSFGLALGALLAFLAHPWSASRLSGSRLLRVLLPIVGALSVLALLALTVLLPGDGPLVYRGGLVLVAVLTALAIAGSITPRSPLGRILDLAPLRWVGRRSYGLYLWHWPVYVLVVNALAGLDRTDATLWELGGCALVLTVAAAMLSYRFVEQPIRRDGFRATFRRWFGSWPGHVARSITAVVVALAVLAAGGATALAIQSDPGQGDAQAAIEQGQKAIASATATPTPSATAAPGGTRPVAAGQKPGTPGGDQISAIGDSVMLASAKELQLTFPGIQIDAVVSRQLSSAPAVVQNLVDTGELRQTLIIGLGTNGPIQRSALDQIRAEAGPQRQIVVINVQAPRGWTPGVNDTLQSFAQQYRNVELANWRDAIAGHLDLLSRDQIHPGDAGGKIYVEAIQDALQRLAELPPLLGPNDYGLAPTPL